MKNPLPAKFYAIVSEEGRACGITGSALHHGAECGLCLTQADVSAVIAEYEFDGDKIAVVEVSLEDNSARDVTEDMLRAICRDAWADADAAAEMPHNLRSFWPTEAEALWGYQGAASYERGAAA